MGEYRGLPDHELGHPLAKDAWSRCRTSAREMQLNLVQRVTVANALVVGGSVVTDQGLTGSVNKVRSKGQKGQVSD
jgi:hypothetical protein